MITLYIIFKIIWKLITVPIKLILRMFIYCTTFQH